MHGTRATTAFRHIEGVIVEQGETVCRSSKPKRFTAPGDPTLGVVLELVEDDEHAMET